MPKIVKPTNLSKLWASAGAKSAPDDSKMSLGWVVETPPHQTENYLQTRNDTAVGHINQAGVPEWSSDVEYIGNFSWTLGSNGSLYACKVTNTGNNPVTDVGETYWSLILDRNKLLKTLETTAYIRSAVLLATDQNMLFNNLNITSLGKSIIQNPSAGAIRNLLGATTVGNNLFTAATQLDARNAIGVASANDSTEGIVARATDGEAISGVNDTKFLTPKKLKLGFSITLAPNGQITFPSWLGGLSYRWGSITLAAGQQSTVTTFSTQCFQGSAVNNTIGTSGGDGAMRCAPSGTSLIVTNAESSTRTVGWTAVGY
jgi:hypothetical protein